MLSLHHVLDARIGRRMRLAVKFKPIPECKWLANIVCAPLRYSILEVYPA
jgi:hypothetical protein